MTPLLRFLQESNLIEGIHRPPYAWEEDAAQRFLNLDVVTLQDVLTLQEQISPGRSLRDRYGMNVRVGNHIAPSGGPDIRTLLEKWVERLNQSHSPYEAHCDFLTLHPFMDGNGRTGRLLWAWHMQKLGYDPFALSFLHRFYYQALEAADGR